MALTYRLVSLIFVLLFMVSLPSSAQDLSTQIITNKLESPWGMARIDPSSLIVTQRGGDVLLVNTDNGNISAVAGGPKVLVRGQGGLLDVKKSPLYNTNGWLYFTYVKSVKKLGATTLARAKLQGTSLVEWQDLLVTKSITKKSRHYGSRIAFDGQGHVFFSVGDRGVREQAQDLTNHAGSILRLNLDGSVPTDNPFIGRLNILPEIYSFGHRNPQGLAFDSATQQLWAIEHGPRGGDELNLIKAGANYGWPIVSHGKEYSSGVAVGEATSKAGYEDPVQVYIPSIAPSSLLLQPRANAADVKQFYIGALKLTHLNQLSVEGSNVREEQRHLEKLSKRIRDVISDGKAHVIVATDDGQLLRVALND